MAARSETRPAPKDERLDLEPRIKLWVEKDGRLVLSDYRAWGKVREIERNLGVTLVQSEAGGAGGGGSRLTPEGERLVALYQRFRRAMESDLGREFWAAFER